MANPGVGNKFVSVNLNKSYGQQHLNHHPHHASTYGTARTRPGSGGGGGMVVLSRLRSSQKTGPKLSVPPPLNLPSLRKEHERFDSLGSSGGPSGGAVGGASRRTSSSVGWTKPATSSSHEKEVVDYHDNADPGMQIKVDGVSKGSGNLYTPPTLRSVTVAAAVSGYSQVDKAAVLRGEDFPSLHATLVAAVGNEKKQKDGLNQKQKQLISEDFSNEHMDSSRLSSSHVDMRPQFQPSSRNGGLNANGGQSNGLGFREQARKRDEYFLGPLPLVPLNPRSDWEDDERDTGHGLTYRSRDHGLSKNEPYWDRDFDMPRASVLPLKPAHSLSDRWRQRDNEAGRFSSSEVPKTDPSGRDIKTPSREGLERNSWQVPSLLKVELNAQDVGKDRNGIGARPSGLNRETIRENKYISSPFRDNTQVDAVRRELGHAQGERQSWNNSVDLHGSRQAELNTKEGYGSEQSNRYRGNASQNSTASKPSYSSVSKVPSINDPVLNFGKEKRPFLKSEKPYLEDPFMKDYGSTGFDGRDPFSGGLIGVVKQKKDVVKQTDFHDPVRESFEAELERVQKMQELERQRIIEEQERAMELARREEEERLRLAREEEERRRRLEEEAREAVWRAEQEQIETLQRAEEQRIAREEEKRMMIMEEERRKQAAKQKLMELEERIAKRQAEVAKGDGGSSLIPDVTMAGLAKEKEVSKVADVNDWEDGERMVERITSSASSDSSGLNRHFEMGSRPHFSRDVSSSDLDRGKPVNSWRRDVFENGTAPTLTLPDQDNGHHSPGRDTSSGGRDFSRKEFFGGAGFMPSKTFHKGGILEPHADDFSHFRGQRWNISGNGDHHIRHTEVESEYHENLTEKFGDTRWGQDRSHGSPYASYSERMQPNSEADGLYSFGRSQYTMRQPRVLPPSFASMNRSHYRGENELTSTSNISDNQMPYDHEARSKATMQTGSDHQGTLGQAEIADTQQDKMEDVEQKLDQSSVRCDSQSSLSITSPPDSPIHLSHDDMEESRDSPVLSAAEEGKEFDLSGLGPVGSSTEARKENVMSASVSVGDDEEWTVDNNEQLQEQEEYDEDEDGYQEEDEVHDIGDDLVQEFEEMYLEEKGSSQGVDNLVLGFNEGVEVGMPCDEFERSARNEETTYVMPYMSVATVYEEGSFNVMDHDGQVLPSVNGQSQVSVDNSSRIFQETEKAMQNLAIRPSIALKTSASSSDLMDHVNISNALGSTQQHSVSSSLVQTVVSTVTSAPSQTEVPVKLQFGLFSGPSLIPSPVPAIQIGSIQMPLHLHPQVGPSVAQVHASQPPLFQFGQLSYTAPISQGVLSLAPQSMSFVQPNVPTSFSLHQDWGGSLPGQPAKDITAENLIKNGVVSAFMDNQPGLVPRPLDLSHGIGYNNSMAARKNPEVIRRDRKEKSFIVGSSLRPESELQAEDSVVKNLKAISTKDFEGQPKTAVASSQSVAKEKYTSTSKGQGLASAGRGKNYIFAVKNSGSRSSLLAPDASSESIGIQRRPRRQRTEFRVRENADKKQSIGMLPANQCGLDDKSDTNGKSTGISTGIGSQRVVVSNRPSKRTFNLEALRPGGINSQGIYSRSRPQKGGGKESSAKSHNVPHSVDGRLQRNIHSEEDVDAPLQSGIVRVFEQPGIEAPSDEDDFIEVRSKRQMLNDRREQREKEIKAKTRVTKTPPRKPRSVLQNTISPGTSNKISTPMIGEGAGSIRSEFVASEGHGFSNSEVSAGFNSLVSQPLAPIGTPAVKSDIQSDIRSQPINSLHMSSLPVGHTGEKSLAPASSKVLDNVQTPLGSWGNSHVCQQVLAISQAQLDEAMKPAEFDSRASILDHSSSVMSSSSILAKDKSFPSTASPINYLLAGEKIQFVTSPTILPPSSRAVSHGIGPPGACRSDIQNSDDVSATENDCSLFFEKDKHSNELCLHLQDTEAEAEAAASAIAVAAISSDDIVGNGLGTCSISVSDTKSFARAEIDGTAAGVAGDLQSGSQSRGEESLSLDLPADLSVETLPMSLWPPLPSPQNASSQMLSHFPGAPPSHFPLYEMNPMLGGPFFAFGLHDESSSGQSQSQKTSNSISAPLGTWQPCHSGVDSFYGPPAGFSGPFIGSPAGIPGVQGPPHMVVYNHFAPVGQFGQVGLSFMGTTYIPSGKQPDWKHNPASSAMNDGEGGEMSNLNMVSAQRNPNNMPAIQHLAPGSPLVPMASPLAMFDVSPFQSSPDMPVQACWSHISASPLQQSVPLSMPLQQPAEVQRPQFNLVHHLDQSLSTNRFPDSQTSVSSDNTRNFTMSTHATVTQLPDELGLVDQTNSTSAGPSTQNMSVGAKSSSMGGAMDVGNSGVRNGSGSNNTGQNTSSAFKVSSAHHKNTSGPQYANSSGYNYQRGSGIPQRNSSGGEWSQRRMGFQGKNQSSGPEKSFPHLKMKQIYVAKQTPNVTSRAL
ncbi:uncharacterized protein LOC120014758 isoform X2 [Tripterygium wilfordii]|uniref:uncharacterized protein LOC120014758 isoform X2 n=1 Tax=Tripterygium wilfordii TaxID=458696 RepID=UPI0018F80750|nr:uncharacterized protein LOC120014758 isoform X2 [Tripterygium wilfordii]